MKISVAVFEKSQTPGFYLTSVGVIDSNLKYLGYLYHTNKMKNIKDNNIEYEFDFKIEWCEDIFFCNYAQRQLLIIYDKEFEEATQDNLANFTYQNHPNKKCFLKIPNNIKILWDYNLVKVVKLLLSYYRIKLMLLKELSLEIHRILLELLRLDYDKYEEVVQSPINEKTIELLNSL